MTLKAQHPPCGAGAARRDLLGGKNSLLDSTQRVRLQHLAKRLHSLGPAALSYFLADLAAGKPFLETVESYAALEPLAAVIEVYAVEPGPFCIAGGRRR